MGIPGSDAGRPLVSVIMPVYNGSAHVADSVASVLGQTYSNLQLVIVDDGSTDGTSEIVASIARSDGRVVVRSQANAGVSVARNLGLSAATGELIAFVDVDDVMLPNMLERMVSAQAASNADVVRCGFFQDRAEGGDPLVITDASSVMEGPERAAFGLQIALGERDGRSVWSLLVRREVLGDLRFEEDTRIGEDHLFLLSLISLAESVQTLAEPLYRYRFTSGGAMHGGGMAGTALREWPLTYARVLEHVANLSAGVGVSESRIQKFSRRQSTLLASMLLDLREAPGMTRSEFDAVLDEMRAGRVARMLQSEVGLLQWIMQPWLAVSITGPDPVAWAAVSVANIMRKGLRPLRLVVRHRNRKLTGPLPAHPGEDDE